MRPGGLGPSHFAGETLAVSSIARRAFVHTCGDTMVLNLAATAARLKETEGTNGGHGAREGRRSWAKTRGRA